MAMREFVDGNGVGWRVWSVAIDQVYSQGVRLGTLGELQDGWLCFEAPSERRRLTGYPTDWFRMTDEDLVGLLSKATPVLRRRPSGPVDIDPGES